MKHFIYTLSDPRTRIVRYIGKTNNLAVRLSMHLCEKRGTHKNNWLYQLRQLGLRPIMEAIEECTDETWAERERFWIAHFRQLGYPLTNLDSGGRSGKQLAQETKAKIASAHVGMKSTPESIAKMKASKLANLTPEVRARIAAAQVGKKHSAETRAKMAASRKGRIVSDETRRKIAESNRRTKGTPEMREAARQRFFAQKNVATQFIHSAS